MRRKDREMPAEFGLEVADGCRYGVTAMVDPDGEPYAAALNLVRDGSSLYFHCAAEGFKIRCLRGNPKVCVSFVGADEPVPDKFTTKYRSALIRGTAAQVTEREEKIHALRLLCLKLAASNMENFDAAIERSLSRTAVWRIDIESVTAKEKK